MEILFDSPVKYSPKLCHVILKGRPGQTIATLGTDTSQSFSHLCFQSLEDDN
jgi:hypothetical protein